MVSPSAWSARTMRRAFASATVRVTGSRKKVASGAAKARATSAAWGTGANGRVTPPTKRGDHETGDGDQEIVERPQDVGVLRGKPDFLVRFAERGAAGIMVARLPFAARKGHLALVMAEHLAAPYEPKAGRAPRHVDNPRQEDRGANPVSLAANRSALSERRSDSFGRRR